jgi:hypothetical protein
MKTIELEKKTGRQHGGAAVAAVLIVISLLCGSTFIATGCSDASDHAAIAAAQEKARQERDRIAAQEEKAEKEKQAQLAAEREKAAEEEGVRLAAERKAQLAAFPLKLKKVKITNEVKKNGNYTAYVSLIVENTGKKTIDEFWFTYIAYDNDGGTRAENEDETLYYKGKIKPGETLDLISQGFRWEVSDHIWSDYYDDYGDPDDYDANASDTDWQRSQPHDIYGIQISIFRAHAKKGTDYNLDVFTRKWSEIKYIKQ